MLYSNKMYKNVKNAGKEKIMKRTVSVILCALLLLFSFIPVAFSYSPDEREEKNKLLASLFEADVSDISNAVKKGLISCEEVTRYYLRRIERYNEKFNCFITLCDDALIKARERDEQLKNSEASGVLFGVPVVVKDNMKYKGTYTTNGRYFSSSSIAKTNAAVVEKLIDAGAVIIGKTNMSTDAQNARTSLSLVAGETKNAYNTKLSAGGSSGGTAVAVSLNFCAAGLGTDTNSSLRYPAALAGCTALRSTFGLVDTKGCIALNTTRDVAGAITRSVLSQAVMLDVLTDGEYGYYEALDADFLSDGIKIGVLEELSYEVKKSYSGDVSSRFDISYRKEKYIDDEVEKAFSDAVEDLKALGADVVNVSMPKLFNLSYNTFISHAASKKNAFYNAFKKFMEENELDAVIFPTYLSAPMKSSAECNISSQIFINNCRALSPSAGIPELTVIIGQHSSGAGIGMEIAALKNSEQLLLNIGYSYEKAVASKREVPKTAPDIYSRYFKASLYDILNPVTQSVPVVAPEEESTLLPSESVSEEQPSDENIKSTAASGIVPYIVVGISLAFITGISFIYTSRFYKRD